MVIGDPPGSSRGGSRNLRNESRYLHLTVSTARAKEELGYEPVLSVEDGLAALAA